MIVLFLLLKLCAKDTAHTKNENNFFTLNALGTFMLKNGYS